MDVSGSSSGFTPNGFVLIKHIHKNHPGVTYAVSEALCEAAAVCLDRHHVSPKEFQVNCDRQLNTYALQWNAATQRARSAHAYANDATKDGAYAISLLCVERDLQLVAVGQAEAGTGSDWYVAPPGCGLDEHNQPNLDDPSVRRLEVSGQDSGNVTPRMALNKRQLVAGASSIPGIAAVVGFGQAVVEI